MSNHPPIQDLLDRLAAMPGHEQELRREANGIAYPEPGPDGAVEFRVTDEARFKQIDLELRSIQAERNQIEGKLRKLEDLLGPGLNVPTTYSDLGYRDRLKSDLCLKFVNKVMKLNPGCWILPEQAIADPRYLAFKAEIAPKIEKIEKDIARSLELAAETDAILAE